jgi:hypothetical protein
MGQALREDQVKANQRIMAWLEGRPYREYPEQRRPRVPELKPEFVLRTYTPPHPAWSEQFFTPLEAACEALKDVALRDGMHVLEPAAGIGHMIWALEVLSNTYSPAPAALSICMTAYEIEPQAHRIGAKLFPWVAWFNRNIFQSAGELAGQFDLVVCNPPFGGGRHLGPQDRSGWHASPTEYLFLELAARALKPGGQAVFIAPAHFVARIPEELEVYLERAGLVLAGRSQTPLPGDFLTTGMRVHSFYWNKEEGLTHFERGIRRRGEPGRSLDPFV